MRSRWGGPLSVASSGRSAARLLGMVGGDQRSPPRPPPRSGGGKESGGGKVSDGKSGARNDVKGGSGGSSTGTGSAEGTGAEGDKRSPLRGLNRVRDNGAAKEQVVYVRSPVRGGLGGATRMEVAGPAGNVRALGDNARLGTGAAGRMPAGEGEPKSAGKALADLTVDSRCGSSSLVGAGSHMELDGLDLTPQAIKDRGDGMEFMGSDEVVEFLKEVQGNIGVTPLVAAASLPTVEVKSKKDGASNSKVFDL
ncbi:circumsporozoite protein-like [Dendrobium catenatum]|uniref:circumsporozoite protein-like n=1 Tax=Dendrobium catenatum TaxID=906689 RepID=UPI0010A0C06A|nr:circumsporozoite protein-like [Dendrobium catenatum]